MKKYSIKTVDGNRFYYIDRENKIQSTNDLLNQFAHGGFVGFPAGEKIVYFNVNNIVYITESEMEDA